MISENERWTNECELENLLSIVCIQNHGFGQGFWKCEQTRNNIAVSK